MASAIRSVTMLMLVEQHPPLKLQKAGNSKSESWHLSGIEIPKLSKELLVLCRSSNRGGGGLLLATAS